VLENIDRPCGRGRGFVYVFDAIVFRGSVGDFPEDNLTTHAP
jgi:hypothetical protein